MKFCKYLPSRSASLLKYVKTQTMVTFSKNILANFYFLSRKFNSVMNNANLGCRIQT